MTTNASCALHRSDTGHLGWLLAGLVLLGGGGWKAAAAQDVVAAGRDHSCAMFLGQLQCWGKNSDGQLGNGTTTSSNAPRPVVALDGTVTAVAAGSSHTCAIINGGLMCWGYNGTYELGNGTNVSSTTPVLVSGLNNGVTAVATGAQHSCAVVNGGLKCWGRNSDGQLGNGDTQDSQTPIDVFPSGAGVTAVGAGVHHTCAVIGGQARCWGEGDHGRLGTNNEDDSLTPVPVVGISDTVVGIAAGEYHSCALLDTGGVQCWGYNGYGQLGDDSFEESWVPVTVDRYFPAVPPELIPLSGATAITAGDLHTCAVTNGGTYCWGSNGLGQLGVGSTESSGFAKPVGSPGADITAVAAGYAHTCALVNGAVVCWGSDEFGQLGDAAPSSHVPVPTVSMTGFYHASYISAGRLHGCVTNNGGAFCWGLNDCGQLGNGTFVNSASPQPVNGLSGTGSGVAAVEAGGNHSCAMMDSGYIKCWGHNDYGQLGSNSFSSSTTPVVVVGLSDATSVATGQDHTCAVRTGGGVRCWGSNEYGRLGDGTSNDSSLPVTVQVGSPFPVPLDGAMTVTAGYAHSCAVVNGGAYCWGLNANGQLGNGGINTSHVAIDVAGLGAGSDVTIVSAGYVHTCAAVGDSAMCWGYNWFGQLGNGTNDGSTTPVAVSGLASGVSAIATGDYHACAVVDGGVKCWGDNSHGQLGDDSFNSSNVPVTALPSGSGITAVTAGEDYTCAIGSTAEGATTTRCWGNGMFGRLANGELGYKDVPVHVIDRIFTHGFGGD
jgi:alpha-tubulin suppressor-like RCC1 family protein